MPRSAIQPPAPATIAKLVLPTMLLNGPSRPEKVWARMAASRRVRFSALKRSTTRFSCP